MNYAIDILEAALRVYENMNEQTKVTEIRTALALLHLFDTAVFIHATE